MTHVLSSVAVEPLRHFTQNILRVCLSALGSILPGEVHSEMPREAFVSDLTYAPYFEPAPPQDWAKIFQDEADKRFRTLIESHI